MMAIEKDMDQRVGPSIALCDVWLTAIQSEATIETNHKHGSQPSNQGP